MCLNKMPPVCPLHCPAESSKPDFFPENNGKIEGTGKGPSCLANPEDGLAYRKSHLDDKSIDALSTVNMEKQLQGSMPESDLKDKDLEMAEKIFLGNDPIELGGEKGDVLNTLETESIFPNSDMVKEAECPTIMRDLVENGMANNEHSDVCSK